MCTMKTAGELTHGYSMSEIIVACWVCAMSASSNIIGKMEIVNGACSKTSDNIYSDNLNRLEQHFPNWAS